MIELVATALTKMVKREVYHCEVCAKDWCRDIALERRPTSGCPTCGGRK
jgi:rubrerythrin